MKTTKKSMIFAMTLLLLTGCGADKAENAMTADVKSDAASSAAEPAAEKSDAKDAAAGAAAEEMNDAIEYFCAEDAEGEAFAAKSADYAPDAMAEIPAGADDGGEYDGEYIGDEPDPIDFMPRSGEPFVLTAGEWNDNANWGFFANLVHNGTIEFPAFGLDPTGRIAVTVTHDGAAVQNQTVLLNADDTHIWQAKTDKNGVAYLFFGADYAGQTLTVETADAELTEVEVPASFKAGQGGRSIPMLEVNVETAADTTKYVDTQVMFILDTTGSMGDEITYLQKDFSAIAEEVANDNMTFSVNFYRDKGDDYVTRCNPFTTDMQALQKALNAEYADGGGDTPEAVAQILDETMNSTEWRADTNKIAFLIFDAPPHSGEDDAAMLQNAVAAAAAQGIHLVPVVASNAERETELFGRALSIMTNSNYVFLTDDSGVGDSHLEPIIGDYDVELLHDIIVRNIREIAE